MAHYPTGSCEPREKMYLLTCAPKEDSNQHVHPHSLIRVFIVRMKKLCFLWCPKCTQWRFWSKPWYELSYADLMLTPVIQKFTKSAPSCSKLMMSLVNDSLKFTSSDTQICWNFLRKNVSSFCIAKATHIFSAKNFRKFYIESAKTVNEMTLNELVKLTTLWTTGPRAIMTYSSWLFPLYYLWILSFLNT